MVSPSLLLIGFLALTCPVPQDGVAAWVAQLKKESDDADPALVKKIANERSREAMQGLLSAYDGMQSIFMRREVVRALYKFDGVGDAQQPALEKLANIAVGAEERELREAALKSLGRCETLGKTFLKLVVDSAAANEVREEALRLHVRRPIAADEAWYRYLWNPEEERRKDEEGRVLPLELESIRTLAFQGATATIDDDELVKTMRNEPDARIRREALGVLERRKSPKTTELAKWMFERVDFTGSDRSHAARILMREEGAKVVPSFLKLAKKKDVTPRDLVETMAELIRELDDDKVNKSVAKLVGKGKPHEKVFALLATQHLDDEKLVKKIRKGLKDRDGSVRRQTARVLAARRDRESIAELQKMIEKPREPGDVRVAIEALGEIYQGSSKWRKQLVTFVDSDDRDVRNTALEQMVVAFGVERMDAYLAALNHADWTTRLVGIDAVEQMRRKEAVPALIDRLEQEGGRMRKAVAAALWQLTGMPFDESVKNWRSWWEQEGDKFEVVSTKKLDDLARQREERRLRQRTRTKAEFFGIRIESHRVVFIIDTSGSMTEAVYGRFIGKREAARIDVAKEELKQAIEDLEQGSLFNILSFSTGIGRWLKSGIGGTEANTREQAVEWIDRLGAGGATNLYDTIKMAFEDPDVDTLFILSDGEPTSGEVTDPHEIREHVAFWNKHRRIKIHTIAIGGTLDVLEWIAKDSGGDHVRFR